MLRARGCTKMVLFICQPEYGVALEDLPHDFSIYYVSDEYSFTTTEVEVSATERKVLGSVDQVYLTSPALMQKRGAFNPNTEFLPMGVDYQKFSTPVPEPDDLRDIPHPRIGYMGHLKRMLDWPLLLDLSTPIGNGRSFLWDRRGRIPTSMRCWTRCLFCPTCTFWEENRPRVWAPTRSISTSV